MALATRAPGSAPKLRAKHAALASFTQSTEALLRRAVVLADGTALAGGPGCVHDLLHMRPGVFALYINATSRGDQLWALVRIHQDRRQHGHKDQNDISVVLDRPHRNAVNPHTKLASVR